MWSFSLSLSLPLCNMCVCMCKYQANKWTVHNKVNELEREKEWEKTDEVKAKDQKKPIIIKRKRFGKRKCILTQPFLPSTIWCECECMCVGFFSGILFLYFWRTRIVQQMKRWSKKKANKKKKCVIKRESLLTASMAFRWSRSQYKPHLDVILSRIYWIFWSLAFWLVC